MLTRVKSGWCFLMKDNQAKIRKAFSKYFSWGFFKNIILTDPEYDSISFYNICNIVKEQRVKEHKTFECNDYARIMYYKLREAMPHAPLGIVHLKRFNGKKMRHACNIAYTSKHDILLINPIVNIGTILHGEAQIRKPIKERDVFTFIYI